MNKKTKVLNEILSHRAYAQRQADILLSNALKDEEFKTLYMELRNLDIDEALGKIKDAKEKREKLGKKLDATLKKMGLAKDVFLPKYDCPRCHDRGLVDGKYCDCFYQKLSNELTSNVGISINKEHTFGNVDTSLFDDKEKMSNIFAKMNKWCENIKTSQYKNLLLSGKMGTGKTYLTECIANKLISQNISVSFYTAFALNNLFLKFHTTFEEGKYDILSPLLDVEVLIIDDLGTEPKYKNVTEEYLYLVINERLSKNMPTIITTNLSLEDILAKYGARIFSRLCNKQNSILLQVENSDMRLKRK